MCRFIDEMEKLKSSSSASVANEKFSAFNEYMHIPSKMDDRLTEVVNEASNYKKSLVFVCGNSGDGKSHLIANLINSNIIDPNLFEVYIDATSSDKKGMKANVKLREKMEPFTDENITDGMEKRIIIAINLGVLNDFLKNYENEFTYIQHYVSEQGVFDNIPAWKYVEMLNQETCRKGYYLGHIDFTSYHRYELRANSLDVSFIRGLLDRIVSENDDNQMYRAFYEECKVCPKKNCCPVYWNYQTLCTDSRLGDYFIDILAKSIIKNNISPSVREINNFFYDIIIGNTFEQSMVNVMSVDRQVHFIHNLSLWLLFEVHDGLLSYTSQEDPLNDPKRSCDQQIISLNLKHDLKKWLREEAALEFSVFSQVYSNIIFCQDKFPKVYWNNEKSVKRDIYKYYLRCCQLKNQIQDQTFHRFLNILYEYNRGNIKGCAELINLVKECVYLWNGRLRDKDGRTIKNGVIFGKGTQKYFLYKNIEVQFVGDPKMKTLSSDVDFPNFTTTMRYGFTSRNSSKKIVYLDVNYELYEFLLEVKHGYLPTKSDRKANVKYDSFVRNLVAISESDFYVYSKFDNGDIYKISQDDIDGYVFQYEG